MTMKESLSEFFNLNNNISELNQGLDYSSMECKRMAWFGDSLLAMYLAKKLFQSDKNLSVEVMSKKKALCAANSSMKDFLLNFTDAASRLPDTLSDHSYGTVFEALLSICYSLHGNITVNKCMRTYIAWVNENVIFSPAQNSQKILQISMWSDTSGGFRDSIVFSDNNAELSCRVDERIRLFYQAIADEEEAIRENQRAAQLRAEHIKRMQSKTSLKAVTNSLELSSTHKTMEIEQVTWYSKKNYAYQEPYLTCCGVRDGDTNKCLRMLWVDPNAKHTGKLQILGRGNGNPQWGRNHIPRGNTPTWSCCNLTAVAPGCVSESPEHQHMGYCYTSSKNEIKPSRLYREKVDSWLSQHAALVNEKRQMLVTYGGLAYCEPFNKSYGYAETKNDVFALNDFSDF